MTYRNQRNQQLQHEMGWLWPLFLIILGSIALPAFALGILLQYLLGQRSWSMWCWMGASGVAIVLAYMLYIHGFEDLLRVQFKTYIQAIQARHADPGQWNVGLLWTHTWPVWLRTLVLLPLVALWREIDVQHHSNQALSLEKQEHQRQQRLARSKKRALQRTRHPEHLPEAIDEQMVIGVAIDDEHGR